MTALEFIVEMQWTFLLLIILVVLVVAMIRSKGFREAALNRRWKVGPSGLEMEPTSPAALHVATATDEEITAAAGDGDADITTFRREAVEELMRTAAHWGWAQAHLGSQNPPDPIVNWDADGGPTIRYGAPSAPDRPQKPLARQMREMVQRHETGRRVRKLREESGLTKEELAQRAGVHATSVSSIEAGNKCPRSHLKAIADALGVSVREI